MKQLFSLLIAAALLVCLLSTPAFAAAPALIMPGEQGDGVTSSNAQNGGGSTATIIDNNGTVISDGSGNATVYTGGPVTVTKHPTGEKVEKGGKASFTAYASSGAAPTWRLISSDTLETIYALDAKNYFNDIVVFTDLGGNRLTIQNIPESMNKWQVEAMFDDGQGGHVFSYGAQITVNGSTANGTTTDKNPNGRTVAVGGNGNMPSINGQPTGATLTTGRSTTLSVTAGTNDGGRLYYQWYVARDEALTDGQAIAGATSANYTPGELPGTRYYYCAVWSEKDGVKSETVYSEAAAVTYPETAATPAPSATPRPSATPAANTTNNGSNTTNTANTNNAGNTTNTTNNAGTTTNNGGNTAIAQPPVATAPVEGTEVTPTPEVQGTVGTTVSQTDSEQRSSLPVILGAIAAVALAAGVGLLVLRRNSGQ